MLLVLVVGVFVLRVLTAPEEANDMETPKDPGPDNTIDVEEPAEEPAEEPDEPEPEPEEPSGGEAKPTCHEIPEGPDRNNTLTRVVAASREPLTIDSMEVFGALDGAWSQVHMGATDTWYASNYEASLDSRGGVLTFSASEPGVYRLMFNASEPHLMEVEVRKEFTDRWGVGGAIFGDVWGELGAPEFDVNPDDPQCRDLVLGHAMEAPVRVGASHVGYVPAVFYIQVLPTPVFTDMGTTLSLANESYYGELVDHAHSRGLKVMHVEQSAPFWELTQEDYDALETMWTDPVWSEAWFSAWREYIVPRAEMAERHGVEVLVLYLFPDTDTFKAEDYVEGWKEIIAEVREVYSGMIGFNVVNADERILPLIDDIDVLLVTIFPGLYVFGLAGDTDPSPELIAELTEGFLYAPREAVGGKIPVYYVFSAQSADGQVSTEDPEWLMSLEGLDFREQVVYYEGVFKALEDEEWVDGFISERWDYFDQYNRVGDSFEARYYDSTREASPRSKPAEDLIKLWLSLKGP